MRTRSPVPPVLPCTHPAPLPIHSPAHTRGCPPQSRGSDASAPPPNARPRSYDPAADTWATLPEGLDSALRVNSHLVALHGRLYFIGGSRYETDQSRYVDFSEKVDVR